MCIEPELGPAIGEVGSPTMVGRFSSVRSTSSSQTRTLVRRVSSRGPRKYQENSLCAIQTRLTFVLTIIIIISDVQ